LKKIPPNQSNIHPKMGNTLERVDPRVQHLAKWLMSVGDSVAAADVNNDGLVDLFLRFRSKLTKNVMPSTLIEEILSLIALNFRSQKSLKKLKTMAFLLM
jgi:hypothetical protein